MDFLFNDVEEEDVYEILSDFFKFLEFINVFNILLNEKYFNELKVCWLDNKGVLS